MLFPYFLTFLFPLGVYLLVLATINRRERPLMISGVWDALLLAFGLSGILLWIGPAVLGAFYERGLLMPGDQSERRFEQVWRFYPWIWYSYYGLVVAGQALMVVSRRNKTVVYNVDTAALENVIARVIAEMGFRTSQQHGLIAFEKKSEAVLEKKGRLTDPAFHGAVDVESFRPLRNATLNWHLDDPRLRAAIETAIDARLADAVTPENPSVGWLLTLSGLIFGSVFLGALLLILARFLVRI